MPKIECDALNCGFNNCNLCFKKSIKVEGIFSRSKLGTFCQSFRNPVDNNSFKEELALDMFDDINYKENKVNCSANYCLFNKDEKCIADTINVGSKGAKYRSETECDSFTLK